MKYPSRAIFALPGLVLLALSSAGAVVAQIPDEFTNLKLLDPAIQKPQLLGIMKSWTSGLGVRCNHCHVGPDNLQGMDFASDEKATKRTARRMLILSRAINGDLLADLPVVAESNREKPQTVSCYTCHRGMSRPPRRIDVELGDAARETGAAGAVVRYHELVTAHGDRGQYDLRPSVLLDLSNSLLDGGDPSGARTVVEDLLAMTPESAPGYAMLGRIELVSGQLGAAEQALARALEIDPDDRMAGWVSGEVAKVKAAEAAESRSDPAAEPDRR